MPPVGLIDTGAIVAIVEWDDHWHSSCVAALLSIRTPLFTTAAVLTEAFHLLARGRRDPEKVWRFVRSGALAVRSIADPDLPQLHELMTKYRDRPMDFADATLVHLARRERLSTVFTVDQADFETYRIDGRRKFRVLPRTRPA